MAQPPFALSPLTVMYSILSQFTYKSTASAIK